MQITGKEGLIQGSNQHQVEQKLVLMSPLMQGLQQDLQKSHPSMQGFVYKYHQRQDRK